jgi:hypothetical protein
MPAVKFDWLDKDTWRSLFEYKFVKDQVISAIYLMEPQAPEPWKPLNEFIDYALEDHGICRFVLVAGSSAECGKPGMGWSGSISWTGRWTTACFGRVGLWVSCQELSLKG